MDSILNRTRSDPDVSQTNVSEKTPPECGFGRYKRKRQDDSPSELNQFKEDIKAMLLSQEQSQKKLLKDIQEGNNNIQSSVSLVLAQNEEFKQRIYQLENTVQEDRKYILILENKIEDLQINCRKANFELKNVPKKPTETKEELIEMVLTLSKNVGGSITSSDIKDIYRVKGKREAKNTPIVVETSSTLLKTDMLKMCKTFNIRHKAKLRAVHLGFRTLEDTPIYVSEQLTAKGARLHFLARDLAKSRNYKFCWTAYGKIYVRKEENSPIIAIKTEAQVQQLLES